MLVNKLVVIRHHTTVVATPRRSETRKRIAEHFHWLTDITCLSRNTRCYSLIFNHWYFFRPRQILFQGVRTQFCSIPYALPFDATVVAASQPRGGVAIKILQICFRSYVIGKTNTDRQTYGYTSMAKLSGSHFVKSGFFPVANFMHMFSMS